MIDIGGKLGYLVWFTCAWCDNLFCVERTQRAGRHPKYCESCRPIVQGLRSAKHQRQRDSEVREWRVEIESLIGPYRSWKVSWCEGCGCGIIIGRGTGKLADWIPVFDYNGPACYPALIPRMIMFNGWALATRKRGRRPIYCVTCAKDIQLDKARVRNKAWRDRKFAKVREAQAWWREHYPSAPNFKYTHSWIVDNFGNLQPVSPAARYRRRR